MRQYRPDGFRAAGDAHLLPLSRELASCIQGAQRSFRHKTLRLNKPAVTKLAEVFAEFAEDLHNGIGIWAAYETHNRESFGVALPLAESDAPADGISLPRVRHLLWVLYPQLVRGLILSPRHRDLERLAVAIHTRVAEAVKELPRGSGIQSFLSSPNDAGWDVKRKLIWLGTHSYMFRLEFENYLADQNRGRWEIGHVDQFICEECTSWSGLGATDVLAGVLKIGNEERHQLRRWRQRHTSFYRIRSANETYLEALNIVSGQPYRVHVDLPGHPFRAGQLVFGSLVPWRDDWYWSGEQEAWDASAPLEEAGLADTMKRQKSQLVCRFSEEYRTQVHARAEKLHQEMLAYHGGRDLVAYPDGLAMAADWQREMRTLWEAHPAEQRRDVARRHGLQRGRPEVNVPPHVRAHAGGIGVFLNPQEGKEMTTEFDTLVAGLARRGQNLTDDQENVIQAFIQEDAVSPAFVHRLVAEYGSDSIRAAFRLPEHLPAYWLEYLLRRHKGQYFRTRYPMLSVI